MICVTPAPADGAFTMSDVYPHELGRGGDLRPVPSPVDLFSVATERGR
jgi:hypothetical protein